MIVTGPMQPVDHGIERVHDCLELHRHEGNGPEKSRSVGFLSYESRRTVAVLVALYHGKGSLVIDTKPAAGGSEKARNIEGIRLSMRLPAASGQ